MTVRRVLLDGSGTDGDGSTWGTGSGGTNAYKGNAGLVNAMQASSGGDDVLVKGSVTFATTFTVLGTTDGVTAALQDPPRVIAMNSASDTDYLPGLLTGAATPAYDHANAPHLNINVVGNTINIEGNFYIYGHEFTNIDHLYLQYDDAQSTCIFEECKFDSQLNGDQFRINSFRDGPALIFINCYMLVDHGTTNNFIGGFRFFGGKWEMVTNASSVQLRPQDKARVLFENVEIAGEPDIVNIALGHDFLVEFYNCKLPASYVLTNGTAKGRYKIVAMGCSASTGITSSVLQDEMWTHFGQVITETGTGFQRTGGATDGAAGAFSYAMNATANKTRKGEEGLESFPMRIWVTSSDTTVTVYFAADDANTDTADLTDDEAWATIAFPDLTGGTQYEFISTRMDLGGTPSSTGMDDTTSTWGADVMNPQKIDLDITGLDYDGWVEVILHYAPGSNADTLIYDPELAVS